ncbi:uncharacterized protein LOC119066606 [Bradysia coprophila]|uniref:uncharacterized protein LOC119066606 n=1 Tax=Bradysia coprophila TaxID=38358 RepID=UPI00187DA013|nr:uncharacterized protein LOC119066606 [Bradysia coprophila]
MSDTIDKTVRSSAQSKPQYRKRPSSQRRQYDAVFPTIKFTEPFYGDTTCPHSAFCGLNSSSQAPNVENILKPSIWQSTYPTPVVDGALADPKVDHCLELARRKKLFIRNVQSIKQCYQKNKSKIEEEMKQIPKDNINTKMVKKFAETLETDPDKYFNGTYDWYFTGGSMDIVDVDGQEFLVHSEGNELQNLKISKLTSNCDIIPTTTYDNNTRSLNKGNTIYEIKSVVNEPYFTVRQKHQLTIAHLRSDTLKRQKIHSEIPLVTSAVDEAMKLILVDAQQHLQLFNLIDGRPISKTKIFTDRMTIDNWSSVRFIDSNQFICASRKIVEVYDIRQSLEPVMHHDLTSFLGYCEDLTCMEQSNNGCNTFIATTHKLHAFDIRHARNDIEPKLTWIHQLKTSPIFMDISKNENVGEMIVIAGIKSGDVKLFDTTTVSDGGTISTHLPYCPVSIHDAYKYARSVGKFLDPNSLVQYQLRQSNTAVKLKPIKLNKFSLLTKNTSGDIFQQDIDHVSGSIRSENQEPRISKMVNWDNELRSRGKSENRLGMAVTNVTNFQAMASYLRANVHTDIDNSKAESGTPQKQDWEMSIEELASYQDVLANSLLDKWVIAQDVEMVEEYADDRMDSWVDSTVEQYHIFQEDVCVKGEPEIREY